MLIYIDGIIIISSHSDMVFKLIQEVTSKFSLKDLGELHYFLGIEVIRTNKGLFTKTSMLLKFLNVS